MKEYVLKPAAAPGGTVDYKKDLNEQQLEVVLAGDGPLLVIAGAGSGKTRTLTYRVARLLEMGIPPNQILLLTFTRRAASEMLDQFEPVPQLLKNVRFNGGAPLDTNKVKARIAAAEAELKGHGRLVIRKSGTEPLIRVMAEGDDAALVERLVDDICEAVAAA